MKEIFRSESAVSAFYREELPYIIVTTQNSVDFLDPKSQKLISSVKIKDAGICDVSDNGRYVAVISPLGIFMIDTYENNKVSFFNARSAESDQSFHAYFAGNSTLVICSSWLENVDIYGASLPDSHSSVHYIDTESFKETAVYSYPNSFAADCFKSGNEIFIHLQPRVDESHEDFEAMNNFLYSYLLKIDRDKPSEPVKTKVHNVDRIFDYNRSSSTFLVRRIKRSFLLPISVEIVDKDMNTVSKLPRRSLPVKACWVNGGQSIIIVALNGIYELDAKTLKQVSKINVMTNGICKYSFGDPHICVGTAKGAVIYRCDKL